MKIQTDSKRPEEPKAPDSCTVFAIYKHLAPPDEVRTWERRYREGGFAYKEMKEALFEEIERYFAESRRIYWSLLSDPAAIERQLTHGAVRARHAARPLLNRVRQAVGVGSY